MEGSDSCNIFSFDCLSQDIDEMVVGFPSMFELMHDLKGLLFKIFNSNLMFFSLWLSIHFSLGLYSDIGEDFT